MTRILVTNDDGVGTDGIAALAAALAPLGEVYVVAPESESSAVAHALTLRRPLRIRQVAERWFGVDGTPADCVYVGINRILEGVPDLVVSGINEGWNLGDDITYSGTVAGALEGVLLGAPAVAVSRQRRRAAYDHAPAAAAARRLAGLVLAEGLPPRTFLNVNMPREQPRGFRVTVQARRQTATVVEEAFDPRRQPYYWIGMEQPVWEPDERSDYAAVQAGWISVTPLHHDWTAHDAVDAVGRLLDRQPAPPPARFPVIQ